MPTGPMSTLVQIGSMLRFLLIKTVQFGVNNVKMIDTHENKLNQTKRTLSFDPCDCVVSIAKPFQNT